MGVVPPPYRIETDRLVIRVYEPRDAPLLKEAIDASLDHLRPWMPWARHEPQPLEQKLALLRAFRGRFDLGTDFAYGVFEPDESRQLGGAGLHPRGGEGSLEIGYWIRADAVGRGLATEVTAVLTRVGFEQCALIRVDVQVDPANERSARIPRKLGFVEEGRLRRRLEPHEDGGERRDSLMFTMLAEELAASPCMRYAYRAYDALGAEL
ncbi:MAG TPA: GNAT family protein [Gaiellaceae bacterium]|nr:GNAT family protein [Gaiellaceae bacterium]